jgi:tetratricopeptide (TPR) repeat protein
LADNRKQFDTAEEQLRRAIELAPRQVGRLLDLARHLAQHGRIQESEATFDKAEQLAPNAPKVYFERAGVYVQQKRNLDRAKALLLKYLGSNLTPDDPPREQAQKLLQEASGD